MRRSLTCGLLGWLAMAASAGAPSLDEYQVKAAFLFNFAKFVDWPAQSFKSAGDPIQICLLGPNPFGKALSEAIAGKSLGERKFALRQIADFSQAATCQMVWVGAQRKHALDAPLCGVLTVGDTDGFAASGGVIGFKVDGGKIKLEINLDAAEQSQLRISSKLLSLAQIVKTQGNSK